MDLNQAESKLVESLKEKIMEQKNKPFKVCVMGQTGTGKSSLINALFGTKLKTDAIEPCTKKPQTVEFENDNKTKMIFVDLPGIGESEDVDNTYLDQYTKYILDSDVVLWTHHADNRSIKFDFDALVKIMNHFTVEQKEQFMSKITIVLTKADLIIADPWMLIVSSKEHQFISGEETSKILESKEKYYMEQFLKPFNRYIVSQIPNQWEKLSFLKNESRFYLSKDSHIIYYKGYLDNVEFERLASLYPKYKNLFFELKEVYNVIACSSLFRYNLNRLIAVIMNKIEESAVFRIGNFTNNNNFDSIDLSKAEKCNNIIVYNKNINKVVYDLSRVLNKIDKN